MAGCRVGLGSAIMAEPMTRSRLEVTKWSSILASQGDKGRERLRSYLCSLALGRDFGETCEDYDKRKGLVEFTTWARGELGV